MSADNSNDDELPAEPGGPEQEPTGRYENIVVVEFSFPDGKVITVQDFSIFADHCLSDDEIQAELNFYIGPLYAKLAGYPRLAAAADNQIGWRVIGTSCIFGSE